MGLALELFVRTSKGTFWWVFFRKGLKLSETKHLGFKSFFFLFFKLWVSPRPSSTRPPSSTHWASCPTVFTRKEGAIRRGLESRSEDHQDFFVYSPKVLFALPAFTMAQFFSSSSLSIGLLLLLLVAYTAAGKGCNCASGFEVHQSVAQWSVGADDSDGLVFVRHLEGTFMSLCVCDWGECVCECVFPEHLHSISLQLWVTADIASPRPSFFHWSFTLVSSWATSVFRFCRKCFSDMSQKLTRNVSDAQRVCEQRCQASY